MNQQEFDALFERRPEENPSDLIDSSVLTNLAPRTLIYGNTARNEMFHVYLDDNGVITAFTCRKEDADDPSKWTIKRSTDGLMASECVPQVFNPDLHPAISYFHHLIYPERCDAEFCGVLMQRFKVHLPFYLRLRPCGDGPFHGPTIDQPSSAQTLRMG